jgi:hypothetical protein
MRFFGLKKPALTTHLYLPLVEAANAFSDWPFAGRKTSILLAGEAWKANGCDERAIAGPTFPVVAEALSKTAAAATRRKSFFIELLMGALIE